METNLNMTASPIIPDKKVAGIIRSVQRDGFCRVPSVFSGDECRQYCNILENTIRDLAARGEYCGSSKTQVIYNYFLHDERLYNLFAHPVMDAVMTELIDKDYVLISPSARNPRLAADLSADDITSGEGWHVDARVADTTSGKLYKPSLSFYSVVVLEPFERSNSATHYLPKSHLRYCKPPDRDADYNYEVMEAQAGSVFFFDSALWHRAGPPTTTSRWSIFNMYGPWFMKPYFRFSDNFDMKQIDSMPKNIQRLLHFLSTPPKDPNSRIGTMTNEPTFD